MVRRKEEGKEERRHNIINFMTEILHDLLDIYLSVNVCIQRESVNNKNTVHVYCNNLTEHNSYRTQTFVSRKSVLTSPWDGTTEVIGRSVGWGSKG